MWIDVRWVAKAVTWHCGAKGWEEKARTIGKFNRKRLVVKLWLRRAYACAQTDREVALASL